LPSPTGARPKIAIDNVVVSAVNTGPNINLSKTSIGNLNYFANQGPSPSESYNLTGSELTSDVSISAPTNFEISTVGTNSGFMDNIILSPNAGALNTTIYARLKSGLPLGNYQGNITHTGGGVSSIPALSLTGEVTPIVLATKLIITNISPASPNINTPFSISLQAVDQNNIPRPVSTNTMVNLSLLNGTGVLSGTLSGEISMGTSTLTINGLIYNKEEAGIIIAASSVSGDPLSTGQSLPFEVIQTIFPNEIKSIRDGNWNDPNTWSCNCVPTFTDNVRVRSPHRIIVVPLPIEQGCALILIEPGAVFDLQTGVFRMNMAPPPPQITNINLTLGNPSNATTTISTPDNYLLDKPQYVMSYNRSKATSNWVSWYLNSSSLGSTSRQNDFRPDNTLPAGWYQVTDTDYSGSGFDRGHMTPSGDRTSSVANNSATFLMTNMIPQAPGNNQGPWEKLESYLRGQLNANGGQEIYIIAGSYGQGGTGTAGFANTISGGKISVPAYTYKIALILPNGENDLNRITNSTRVIAVIMPNIESIRPNQWQPYRTTVDAIEAATGYDFLSNVPATIQDVLEAQTDSVAN
jgi:endonuclease G